MNWREYLKYLSELSINELCIMHQMLNVFDGSHQYHTHDDLISLLIIECILTDEMDDEEEELKKEIIGDVKEYLLDSHKDTIKRLGWMAKKLQIGK